MKELVRLAPRLDVVSLANRRQKLPRHLIRQCGDDRGLYLLRGNDIGAESYFITAGAARRLLAHRLRQDYEAICSSITGGIMVYRCCICCRRSLPKKAGHLPSVMTVRRRGRVTASAGLMRRFNRLRDSLVKRRGFSANLRQISIGLTIHASVFSSFSRWWGSVIWSGTSHGWMR